MQRSGQPLHFKIVLIGDSGVGKSNLMVRYTKDDFEMGSPSTIGIEFLTKTLQIQGMEVRAQVWDTAGQERFRALARAIYNGTSGAMVVYDVTCQISFDSVQRWLDQLETNVPASIPIMLVGNKCDLGQLREVPMETGQRFAEEHGLLFLETSALEATNVEKAFDWMVREMVKNMGIPLVNLPSKKAAFGEGFGAPFSIMAPGAADVPHGKACGCKL